MNKGKRPSLNELAAIITERAGKKYDTDFFEEAKVMVHYWRQRILVDSLNAKEADREFFKVWFDLELEDFPISTFEGFPEGTCVKRTKLCLPDPIRANSVTTDFVGYLNKEKRIPMSMSLAVAKAMTASKYSNSKERAVLINKRIYVFNYLGPGISVAMIPEDMSQVPKEGLDCYDCSLAANSCYTDDAPYPISGDMAQRIIQAILATELNRNIPDPKAEEVPISNEAK